LNRHQPFQGDAMQCFKQLKLLQVLTYMGIYIQKVVLLFNAGVALIGSQVSTSSSGPGQRRSMNEHLVHEFRTDTKLVLD
jgi:hypothetical protein